MFVDARERERFFDSKMENQPNEILEHIFKQFNDFGVIKKCSKTLLSILIVYNGYALRPGLVDIPWQELNEF